MGTLNKYGLLLSLLLGWIQAGASQTSHCNSSAPGLTPQYKGMNALQDELGRDDLIILAFPCNQFGKQEPAENHEILPLLKYIRPGKGFVPNFQLFKKGDVNGENEQQLFTYLKNACAPVGNSFGNTDRLFWQPLKISDIKWNFEKFLVGPDGKAIQRWYPQVPIATVREDIIRYMSTLPNRQQRIL
ncbi:hypothetical protein chiPu_0013833 [Chiloscyllium punctatum]|uniref:Glutathione peroxidase n=1 Tax=Chiloscyllium punctatum TaxID=137246 RepID=A0A401SY79_CHIPU|nr:hypothetical protein [Chiloscyllium punctatum]